MTLGSLVDVLGPVLLKILTTNKMDAARFPHVLEHVKQLEKQGINGKELLQQQYNGFASVIRDEDYVAAASSHKGLKSGNIDYLTFGKEVTSESS